MKMKIIWSSKGGALPSISGKVLFLTTQKKAQLNTRQSYQNDHLKKGPSWICIHRKMFYISACLTEFFVSDPEMLNLDYS